LESEHRIAGILGLVILAIAVIAGWQIATSGFANSELQSEMNDIAAQSGARVGLAAVNSKDEFSNSVIERAQEHGTLLNPQQVTVDLTATPDATTIYLSAKYDASVNMLVFSFPLHFAPSSIRKLPIKAA
jgi:hypothetical protein